MTRRNMLQVAFYPFNPEKSIIKLGYKEEQFC